MRWLILAALPFLAAGCSTTVQDPFLETGAIHPDAPPLSTEVSPDFAVAYLPSASGRIQSVRQTARSGFFEQAIVYSNATASAGENVLTVRVGQPSEGMTFLRAPTRRAVIAEMRQALPGVAMRISDVPGQNGQGVYGYATGPLGTSGSCLYAWQLAKRVSAERVSAYAAQVRLRFCHPAMSQERIAAVMGGLRMKPVTRNTFDMLQYAGGSGYSQTQPVLVRAEPVVVADDSVEIEPRRLPKRRVVEERPAEERVVIRNAVRVPLPGEKKVKVAVLEEPIEKPKTKARSALVPMPGTIALNAE
ncbi:cellulose biosynthesis protein BcsN [Shinella sp. CPCC 101442]|uniref:cellulose biosynthesis protein BcsN n=1 Tax=Shinella sp. CPCC 101442 TaxID=2932265 RepID=UPI00215217AE|nr:cellulose biosynthesis protein BcsN [Shinella sp. CPCC 101442]MCR6501109.1 cellulose biosynthesis protein BcsN [Shinella sp. CPCC 101442]